MDLGVVDKIIALDLLFINIVVVVVVVQEVVLILKEFL